MEVHIKKDLENEVRNAVRTLHFENTDEFVNRAIRDKILELKKKKFIEISNKTALALREKGIKEEDILLDFEKNRE